MKYFFFFILVAVLELGPGVYATHVRSPATKAPRNRRNLATKVRRKRYPSPSPSPSPTRIFYRGATNRENAKKKWKKDRDGADYHLGGHHSGAQPYHFWPKASEDLDEECLDRCMLEWMPRDLKEHSEAEVISYTEMKAISREGGKFPENLWGKVSPWDEVSVYFTSLMEHCKKRCGEESDAYGFKPCFAGSDDDLNEIVICEYEQNKEYECPGTGGSSSLEEIYDLFTNPHYKNFVQIYEGGKFCRNPTFRDMKNMLNKDGSFPIVMSTGFGQRSNAIATEECMHKCRKQEFSELIIAELGTDTVEDEDLQDSGPILNPTVVHVTVKNQQTGKKEIAYSEEIVKHLPALKRFEESASPDCGRLFPCKDEMGKLQKKCKKLCVSQFRVRVTISKT